MAKDDAVRNQKVFIALTDYVVVLNEYNRARQGSSTQAFQMAQAVETPHNLASYREAQQRRIAIEWVLDTLQLPREGK